MNAPESMDREAVAKWLGRIFIETRGATRSSKQATLAQADAVLALVENRVRAALLLAHGEQGSVGTLYDETIVSRVLERP